MKPGYRYTGFEPGIHRWLDNIMIRQLKRWSRIARRDVLALYLAGRDPRVPWFAKMLAMATAAYALSPIDLIPDFIPVIGYLDDLLLVPAGITLTVWMIPKELMQELRKEAAYRLASDRPRSKIAAAVIIFIWLGLAVVVGFLLLGNR